MCPLASHSTALWAAGLSQMVTRQTQDIEKGGQARQLFTTVDICIHNIVYSSFYFSLECYKYIWIYKLQINSTFIIFLSTII